MHALSTFLSLFAAVPVVAGHAYVVPLSLDGSEACQGNTPNSNGVQSPITMINSVSPIQNTSSSDLSWGQGAQKAAKIASANPGSTVSFKWVSGTGANWPHEAGPLMTYLASGGCANSYCSSARWFKIEESGLRSDGAWAM
ncbi:hypothetical protein DICSQDRAFT_169685 [Dichomitus squalens LYAD-421 SS1]|uniref:lytic cellulose monooxygenase (C4-dehydrogenating) n=1 Tax=Dichomitus squalens (strain LYAD-421) TaxID=732165 RepID=R7T2V4_DICSQ|nr:uncharacterized protein DICSQDRAFT_169685 [Dichomitus squalens LYAD-421 SS1]EJF62112.1 hypothetical protein DICSQDRAFT_169685 [Dichomitus squalens LYAD-421 SS1]